MSGTVKGVKISELPELDSLSGSDVLPVVSEGENYRVSGDVVFAGARSASHFSGSEVPTLSNHPASLWSSDADKARNVGVVYDRKVTSNILRNTNFDVHDTLISNTDALASNSWHNFYWYLAGNANNVESTAIREIVPVTDCPNKNIRKGIRMTSFTIAAELGQATIPIVAGKIYTASVYARKLTGATSAFRMYIGLSSIVALTTFTELTSDWKLFKFVFTAPAADRFNFYIETAAIGDSIEVCGMKLEEGINDNPEWSDYSSESNYIERYQFAGANGVYGWDKVSYRDDANFAMAADGVYVMYHRNSDDFSLAVEPERWPALEDAGEVADGVLLIDGGRSIVVAPDESQQVWATAAVGTGKYITERLVAFDDFAGKKNTENILKLSGTSAAEYCNSYSRVNANGQGLSAGMWWLPSMGELLLLFPNLDKINYALSFIKGATPLKRDYYWSSDEYDQIAKWRVWFENFSASCPSCTIAYNVRPVSCFAHLATDTPVPTAKELAEQALRKINGIYVTSGNTIIDYSVLDLSPSNGSVPVAVNMESNGATAVVSVPADVEVSFSVHPSKSYTLKIADNVAGLKGAATGRLVYTLMKVGSYVYINGALYD